MLRLLWLFALVSCASSHTFDTMYDPCDGMHTIKETPWLKVTSTYACAQPDVVAALYTAAETYHETTNGTLVVKSAVRSKQRQGEIYWRNCFDGVYTGCVHPTGRYGVPKDLLYNATSENEVVQLFIEFAKNDGHVGGHAVDVWPIEADGYVANTTLMEHMRVSMLHSGLCRLDTEAWHFSLGDCDNVSTYQRDGTVYDPVSCDCLWDYSLNRGE